MSTDAKAMVNISIDAIIVALVAATSAKAMDIASKSLPPPKADFTIYDVGMNVVDLTVGGYACTLLHYYKVLPLIKQVNSNIHFYLSFFLWKIFSSPNI